MGSEGADLNRRRKLVAAIAAVLVAGGVVVVWRAVRAWDDGMCGNEIAGVYPSPNGRLKVVVFERDCGATTSASTQASILEAGDELPAGSGNIYVADHAREAPDGGRGGAPRVSAAWSSGRAVVITRESARVFKKERRYEGIDVSYVERR